MKELILMTAAYRIDNLRQSYESIEMNFSGRTNIHITWLICYDQYNAFGDIEKIKELCRRGLSLFGMGYLIYNAGKDKQPNYGGILYNDALKWIKSNWFANKNPWVYIFDDDNIIHPSMAECFNAMTDLCESKNKGAIWMTKSQSQGMLDIANERMSFAFHHFKNGGKEAIMGLPDPSQILLRYSEIEKMNFFENGMTYDHKIWEYFDINIDRIMMIEEMRPNPRHPVYTHTQCYHNGQVMQEAIDLAMGEDKRTYSLICQSIDMNDDCAHRFVLPKEIGDKAFAELIDYNRKKEYIKTDRIFDSIDKIYILTMVNTPERWDFVVNQFKKLGIYDEICNKIEIVKAVKIPCLSEKNIETISKEGLGDTYHYSSNTYSTGLFSCSVEHYRILKQAIAEGYSRIMYIEDDACFFKKLDYLKKAFETIPEEFDILHLEGYFCPENEDRYNRCISHLAKTPEEGMWDSMENIPLWATACLIYSKEGMEKYVSEQEKYFLGVDTRTSLMKNKSYYYTYPLVRQEDKTKLKSSIEPEKKISDGSNIYLHYTNREDYFSIFEA